METEIINTREDIARLLGEDPSEIKTIRPSREWSMRQGVIVKLHIFRWRGIVSLTWDDLGLLLPETERWTLEERLKLGHKYLLPKWILNRFSSIEYQARANLKRNSFKTHWGYFVPVTSYQTFKRTNEEYEYRYLDLVDMVFNRWEDISSEVSWGHVEDAKIAWQTALALDLDSLEEKQVNELDLFIYNYVERLTSCRPSREEFRNSCNYEVELFFIPLPGFRAGEQAYVQQLWDNAGVSEVLAQAQADMEKDVLLQVKEEKEQLIDGFYRDVLSQLMTMVNQIMDDLQASMQRNQYIPSRTAIKLRTLVRSVRQLNFLGVDKIDQVIKPVEDLLYKPQKQQMLEIKSLEAQSSDIINEFRETLDRWGVPTIRKGRDEEELDFTEAEELRRSRPTDAQKIEELVIEEGWRRTRY